MNNIISIINNPLENNGRVEFSPLFEQKNIKIKLVDLSTNLDIHKTQMDLALGINYFISPSQFSSKYIQDFYIECENENGLIQKEYFLTNKLKKQGIVINNKFIPEIKQSDSGGDYNTYCEVFEEEYYLSDMIKPCSGDIVVDIGSNIGISSLYFQQFNPEKIICVEPGFMDICMDNLSKFDNVEFVEKAIYYKDGTSTFNKLKSSAASHLIENDSLTETSINVETININTLINNYNLEKIDYLKVDCEGGEKHLFETINDHYLHNNIRNIVVEYHSKEIKDILLNKINLTLEKENGENIGMLYYYNESLLN
jgi:FkbM family methyltransferase